LIDTYEERKEGGREEEDDVRVCVDGGEMRD